ncbi:hypothetical protein EDB86DRAFT_1606805 [Lactarius hatsudake]|nr:hypothetical protein EDB86DRAFT_1606805 [Lactarius hatsudake]
MQPGTTYIALASLCLFVKLGCTSLLRSGFSALRHSYVGTDYPYTSDISYRSPILMNTEGTEHYQLSVYNADAEWAALAPNDGTNAPSRATAPTVQHILVPPATSFRCNQARVSSRRFRRRRAS